MEPEEVVHDRDGVPLSPRKEMGPVEVLWEGDRVTAPVCRLTHKLKTLPSLIPLILSVKIEFFPKSFIVITVVTVNSQINTGTTENSW